jgi:hypothetical protein
MSDIPILDLETLFPNTHVKCAIGTRCALAERWRHTIAGIAGAIGKIIAAVLTPFVLVMRFSAWACAVPAGDESYQHPHEIHDATRAESLFP